MGNNAHVLLCVIGLIVINISELETLRLVAWLRR